MAMFHSHTQVISRSSGRSSVAAAAYRSGCKLTNERDGIAHDYSKKAGIAYSEIILPDSAPERWLDRSTLWNDVERSERSSNAQLAREIEYALPRELDLPEQIALTREYAQSFADEGMVADFSIHQGRNDNPHVHMMLTMRPCDAEGFAPKSVNAYLVRNAAGDERRATSEELKALDGDWAKVYAYKSGESFTQRQAELAGLHPTKDRKSKAPIQETRYLTDWNEPHRVEEWRRRLADTQNAYLADKEVEQKVDHRSFGARGIEQMPTLHEGPTVRRAEDVTRAEAGREGRAYIPATDRRRENIWIELMNRRLREMVEKASNSMASLRRMMRAVEHAKAANARKRSMRNQGAGRRAQQRGHGGLSR